MTPITLKIQGLNSFTDEQVIDFKQLTKHGLFGIFGNTGSGKSTILDAITLALYGVISRKTKQFINSKSDTAIVNFEFSVVDKVTKKRVIYKVERTFKNNKDNNANTKHAKLSNVTNLDDIEVLATKVNDVNQKCLEVINLNIDDFFRTVVIPQGKFSEFLELENKARRDMLENLFNLQEYGEIFENKIKHRKNKLTLEVEVINKTLEGIIILTPEEYALLEEELAKMDEEFATKNKEYNTIFEEYNSIKTNLTLQTEEALIKENIEIIEGQRLKIDQLREKIKVAEKAQTVKPIIDNINDFTQQYDKATESLAEVENQLISLLNQKVKIDDNFTIAEANKNTKTPILIDRKSKLEQALTDEKTLKELDFSIAEINGNIHNFTVEKDVCKADLNKILDTQSKLNQLQNDLQTQITQNTVSTALKDSVVEGKTLSNDVITLEKELTQQTKEKITVTQSIDDLKQQLEELNETQTQINTKIGSLSISKSDENDIRKLDELNERLKINQGLSQQYEINKSITALKDACHIGEPCPVCGKDLDCLPAFCADDAIDYRKIINTIEVEIKTLNEEMQSKQMAKIEEKHKLEVRLAEVKTNITNTKTTIDTKNNQLTEVTQKIIDINDKIESNTALLNNVKMTTQIEDFNEIADNISAKEKAKEQLEPQLTQARQDLEELNKKSKDITDKSSKIGSEISGLEGKLETNLANQKSITQKLKEQFGENFDISGGINKVTVEISTIEAVYTKAKKRKDEFEVEITTKNEVKTSVQSKIETLKSQITTTVVDLTEKLKANGFENEAQVTNSLMAENIFDETKKQVENFDAKFSELIGGLKLTQEKLNGVYKTVEELNEIEVIKVNNERVLDEMKEAKINKTNQRKNAEDNLKKFEEQSKKQGELNHKLALIDELLKLVGSKNFVQYIAIERLKRICLSATDYLLEMTDNKYELRINDKGDFVRRSGAYELPVSTLSGGEKFTTSLALALALSTEIQKKAGTKMELFFLDEGFGSLDENLAETVIEIIAKIPNENMKVGIISHVESIKDRIPIKLLVEPENSVKGSTVSIA